MHMKRNLLVFAVAIGAALVMVGPITGNAVDCFDPKYAGDISIVEDLPSPDASTQEIARHTALENAFASGALGRSAQVVAVRYGTVATSTLGMDKGKPAFVVAIQSDDKPYQMIGTPVNYEPPLVVAPCQIVVLSPEGELLFSLRMQFDATSSGDAR